MSLLKCTHCWTKQKETERKKPIENRPHKKAACSKMAASHPLFLCFKKSWNIAVVLPATCDISGGGALPLLTAGRQFSGRRVKVAQLAGESGGAAKAAASRRGHIVDGVHGGEHWRIPGNHHRLSTAGVLDVLRRTRGCEGEDTEGQQCVLP